MNRKEKAQMFLIGAISLAIVFVTITLLINTAIFTENIASRSETVGGANPDTFTSQTEQVTAEFIDSANKNLSHDDSVSVGISSSEDGETRDVILRSYDVWAQVNEITYGERGVITNSSITSPSLDLESGTRLGQDELREYTDSSGNSDWNITGQGGFQDFHLTQFYFVFITNSSSFDSVGDEVRVKYETSSPPSGTNYTIRFQRVDVGSEPGLDIVVENADNGNVIGTCTREFKEEEYHLANESMYINLKHGIAGNSQCDPLVEAMDWSFRHRITVENGAEGTGEWELVYIEDNDGLSTDREFDTANYNKYNASSNTNQPFFDNTAIAEANVRITYVDGLSNYEVRLVNIPPREQKYD